MEIGGIETALINLLKYLSINYDVTLVLDEKKGELLENIPEGIHVEENYKPSEGKNVFIRKIKNFIKQQKFKKKYHNKFDFSACFATYSMPCSYIARIASKNSALWVHNNYLDFYNNDSNRFKKFFMDLHVDEFKKIVFVSKYDKLVFNSKFPELTSKTSTCNNLIDYKKILNLADEKISDLKESEITTFVNIGRQDEKQKRLSRIINASKRLREDGYKFRVVFIGDGPAHGQYINMCKGMQNMIFLGSKNNPYPYLKMGDAFLMSSEFEGFPVVWIEAKILHKMIITTKVSDWKSDIVEAGAGIAVDISEDGVYEGMKQYLEISKKSVEKDSSKKVEKSRKLSKNVESNESNGEENFKLDSFSPEKYNKEIQVKLEKIINN